MIEIIYHGNITSNIAAGILVRRRFITGRIERAILKRMFRAREHTHIYYTIFSLTTGWKELFGTAQHYVFDVFYWHLSFFKVEEIINRSCYIFVKEITRYHVEFLYQSSVK